MLQLYMHLASSRLARHAIQPIQPIQLYSYTRYTAYSTIQPPSGTTYLLRTDEHGKVIEPYYKSFAVRSEPFPYTSTVTAGFVSFSTQCLGEQKMCAVGRGS